MGGVFLIKHVNTLTNDALVSESLKLELLARFRIAWAAHLKAKNARNSLAKGSGVRTAN
jgi:hypothetical protein